MPYLLTCAFIFVTEKIHLSFVVLYGVYGDWRLSAGHSSLKLLSVELAISQEKVRKDKQATTQQPFQPHVFPTPSRASPFLLIINHLPHQNTNQSCLAMAVTQLGLFTENVMTMFDPLSPVQQHLAPTTKLTRLARSIA